MSIKCQNQLVIRKNVNFQLLLSLNFMKLRHQ